MYNIITSYELTIPGKAAYFGSAIIYRWTFEDNSSKFLDLIFILFVCSFSVSRLCYEFLIYLSLLLSNLTPMTVRRDKGKQVFESNSINDRIIFTILNNDNPITKNLYHIKTLIQILFWILGDISSKSWVYCLTFN